MTHRIAVLEVLDRDGHVRHYRSIEGWPVSVGRALDNDLVVDDEHIAAHHFKVASDESGVFVEVGDTINGLRANGKRLARGQRSGVGNQALRLDVGDSHLCLRLADHALLPEKPIRTPHTLWHSVWPPLLAGVLVLSMLLFTSWLDTDPDELTRALGGMLVSTLSVGLAWCAGWALLSKIFTRRSHFWWHVRVLLIAVLAVQLLSTATHYLAFALSWPTISDFSFVGTYAVGAAMLYFHVLGIEPRQPGRMRAVAAGIFLAGFGLTLWFNHQARDQFGDELYMNHLFPPGWRLAKPVDTATFVKGLAPLQATLDEKAKKRDTGGEAGPGDDD
jgi:hypothetical protein